MAASGLLREADRQLANEERVALAELRDALVRLDATPENLDALARSIQQLDELFLLVIVGEFNSGKSAFINALLGDKVLEEGVTPTTAQVNVLRFGPERSRVEQSPHLHLITAPVEFLRDIHLVDTPGTNAVIREHEAITSEFVPRSDLVLFVTSADRPFTESERQFLQAIRDWGKKVVVILNKVDLFESDTELQQVVTFIAQHAKQLLGAAPDIFPVSARLAMRAKRGEPALWETSRFEAVEQYLHRRLDERERLRLKLANPLGVGRALADRYFDVVGGRMELLKEDVRLLDEVERQNAVFRNDMQRQFEARMSEIENVLLLLEGRGHKYFDEILRIGRVFDLLNKSRVREGFEREVVADAPVQIERSVSDLIDWMVSADLRQWQQVTLHLARRREQYRDRIVGDPEVAGFHVERARLIESVGREAQRLVDGFDRQREAAALAEGARNSVAAAAAMGAGARDHRHDCRHLSGGGRHGHPPRGSFGDRGVVRDPGTPPTGQRGTAQQNQRAAGDPREGAPRTVSEGNGAQRRARHGRHRALQPLRARRAAVAGGTPRGTRTLSPGARRPAVARERDRLRAVSASPAMAGASSPRNETPGWISGLATAPGRRGAMWCSECRCWSADASGRRTIQHLHRTATNSPRPGVPRAHYAPDAHQRPTA